MQQENSSQKISRELRWLFEQNDWLTLEYVTSCSGVPQSTVHRAKEGNVRLQRRIALKLAEFIDDETKGKVSVNYLLNANGRSAEVSRKGKNCEHTDQDYSGLNLSLSDHSQSVFTRCDFSRANLTRAIFREAKFLDCTFDHAQMLGAVCPTGQMRILQNQILGILFTQGSTLRALRQVRTFAGCQICIRADLSERTQISQDFAGFPIPMRLLLNCFSKMQSKGQNGR